MNIEMALIEQIAALENEIMDLEAKGCRLFQGRKAQALLNDSASIAEFAERADAEKLWGHMQVASHVDTIDRMRKSLAMQLVQVNTKYVVTDGDLISPAGFSCDDNVYIQNAIMIHTDTLDMQFPRCNVELKAYDLTPQPHDLENES